MKNNSEVLYICNGEKECHTKGHCYKNSKGDKKACRFTSDIRYAKNFRKEKGFEGQIFSEQKGKVYRAITRFRKIELEEAKSEKRSKRKQVCIDPDSVIGREIKYQTALLHEILDELRGGKPPLKE